MSSLVIVGKALHPVDSGSKMRAINLIRAARSIGEVDLFSCAETLSPEELALFDDLGVRRVVAVGPPPEATPSRWLSPVDRVRPSALRGLQVGAIRQVFERSGLDGYHRVLFVEPITWWLLRPCVTDAPVIVDLENVMSSWSARAARTRFHHLRRLRGRALGRAMIGAAQALLDSWRWARLERRILATSNVVIVCSEAERARLGGTNVAVGPNGYDRPTHPVGRVDVGSPPVLVFPGKMTYEPNLDAARFLLDEILPCLRRLVPGVRVMIVGRSPAELLSRDGADVEVMGFVDDIDAILARADAMVVPLRSGGGTRGKILEAWAHRLPVVSTTFGADGLDVSSGVDLLLADSPERFAEACRQVLTDSELRSRLAEGGYERWSAEFDWEQCRVRIVTILRDV